MQKGINRKQIELLAPAGDLERLKTAVVFGADAVYCGLPSWSMRNPREITFTICSLKEGIAFAHERGVKVYLTFNVYPHEGMFAKLEKEIIEIKNKLKEIDGIILSDLGTLSLVKKYLPEVPIHISTQANTLNSEAIKMWEKLGASRIVLARELTLKEIKEIKKKLSAQGGRAELEVFGHGAMCMAYSGRCLLSKYFTGREANLGECAQSCRWKYKVKKTINQENNKSNEEEFYLEEETRPGDLIEVQEDPNGTYFMNSKEICLLDIIDKFIEAGIDSLKIEGRAKTVYYLATVTRAYRKAIDLYYAGKLTKKAIKELLSEFDLIQNRGYSHGFLLGRNDYEQEYNIAAFKPNVLFLGVVLESKKAVALVEVKNKFKVGENVEIVTPNEIIRTKIKEIKEVSNGNSVSEILKPQEKVWVKFDTKNEIPERSVLRRVAK